jgi:hypothetical protein
MWETAEAAGIATANLMWCVLKFVADLPPLNSACRPGPPVTHTGASSKYFVRWKVIINLVLNCGRYIVAYGSGSGPSSSGQ